MRMYSSLADTLQGKFKPVGPLPAELLDQSHSDKFCISSYLLSPLKVNLVPFPQHKVFYAIHSNGLSGFHFLKYQFLSTYTPISPRLCSCDIS